MEHEKQLPPSGPNPNIGFQPPPAYDQHQSFPQQFQGHPQMNPHSPPQVVTSKKLFLFNKNIHDSPNQTLVISTNAFGPEPSSIKCPSCHQSIITRIDFESSTKTHLMAGLICLLFWPCVCLPYMMDSCKNANHYCPNCSAYLGSYRSG